MFKPSKIVADGGNARKAMEPADEQDWIDMAAAALNGSEKRHDAAGAEELAEAAETGLPYLEPETVPYWVESQQDAPDQSGGAPRLSILIALLAFAWIGFGVWLAISFDSVAAAVPLLTGVAAGVLPLLLLALFWAGIRRRQPHPVTMLQTYAANVSEQASLSLRSLAEAEARLMSASSAFDQQARKAAATAEVGANELLASMGLIETQSAKAGETLRESGQSATETLALMTALDEAAPKVQARLIGLAQALDENGAVLAERGGALEQQFRAAAEAAAATQAQLRQTHGANLAQMKAMGMGAREAGDELTAVAEMASARLELMLERGRTGLTATNEALEQRLSNLEILNNQGDRTARIMESLGDSISDLSQRLANLESATDGRRQRMADGLGILADEAGRLSTALHHGDQTADALIGRAEALLVALDSNIREIDESFPAALARLDNRLATTQDRLSQTTALVEGMAGTADGISARLERASETMVAQTTTIEATIAAGDASLARQNADIAAMRAALEESTELLGRLADTAGPQMVSALEQVRASAEAAAHHAQQAIDAVVTSAVDRLGQASGAALEAAVNDKVNAQIGQIAEITDNAVKSAHRATDHLMRQMMTLTDSADHLESRMASAASSDEARSRDFLTDRSAHIIAALNNAAIDVAKWLDHEVGDREWARYLAGEKSLFTRRAVKLVSGSDTKRIHARYDSDAEFRELINRYVDDFEAMLNDILASRNGHSLAIALLSSDVGKLYVALAQAIERLRR